MRWREESGQPPAGPCPAVMAKTNMIEFMVVPYNLPGLGQCAFGSRWWSLSRRQRSVWGGPRRFIHERRHRDYEIQRQNRIDGNSRQEWMKPARSRPNGD